MIPLLLMQFKTFKCSPSYWRLTDHTDSSIVTSLCSLGFSSPKRKIEGLSHCLVMGFLSCSKGFLSMRMSWLNLDTLRSSSVTVEQNVFEQFITITRLTMEHSTSRSSFVTVEPVSAHCPCSLTALWIIFSKIYFFLHRLTRNNFWIVGSQEK